MQDIDIENVDLINAICYRCNFAGMNSGEGKLNEAYLLQWITSR
jgi:hypothetical protein